MDYHDSRSSIEVFIFDLADGSAVSSIGKVSVKTLNVKQISTSANLFIGCKADLKSCVIHLGL